VHSLRTVLQEVDAGVAVSVARVVGVDGAQ
jgi:hypothetical protein